MSPVELVHSRLAEATARANQAESDGDPSRVAIAVAVRDSLASLLAEMIAPNMSIEGGEL